MIYQVFIEGVEIDLDPKTVIAITIQATAIGSGDVTSRLTSFTNQITVPATHINVSVLEMANAIESTSTFPYSMKSFIMKSSDLQIMQGQVVIKVSSTKEFSLQFYGDVKTLGTTLGTSVLSDLDFGDSSVTWDQTTMDALRNARSGFPINNGAITAPVVNYGQINPSLANGSIGDYYLPCVVYKNIILQIFTEAGYTPTGTFYTSDDFFNRAVMTYGRNGWPGTTFKTNEILPDDITQIDLIKDFLIRFNLYLRFSDSQVEIVQQESIFTATPVDWTTKNRDYGIAKKYSLEYAWPGWARTNTFKYPSVNPDTTLIPFVNIISNDGSIDISNPNISSDRNVYESLFYPHQSMQGITTFPIDAGQITVQIAGTPGFIFGATCPVWNNIPSAFLPFDNDPKPMLCLLRDQQTFTGPGSPLTESDIYYDGNLRSDYKIAFFALYPYDGAGTEFTPVLDNMRWRNDFGTSRGLLDLYYPTLESILQTAKKVTNYYNLSQVDIASLDLLTPIFDTDSKYLISKVYDFVPGRLTKVELLKIS